MTIARASPPILRGAIRIWWIAGTVVVSAIERKKPRLLTLEMRAHQHMLVDRNRADHPRFIHEQACPRR